VTRPFDALKDLHAAQIASPRKLLNSLFFFLIGTIWRLVAFGSWAR